MGSCPLCTGTVNPSYDTYVSTFTEASHVFPLFRFGGLLFYTWYRRVSAFSYVPGSTGGPLQGGSSMVIAVKVRCVQNLESYGEWFVWWELLPIDIISKAQPGAMTWSRFFYRREHFCLFIVNLNSVPTALYINLDLTVIPSVFSLQSECSHAGANSHPSPVADDTVPMVARCISDLTHLLFSFFSPQFYSRRGSYSRKFKGCLV